MTEVVFIILTVICAYGWFSNKIGMLTILLYYAECGVALPSDIQIEKYREKVIKKLLHIPS